MINRSKLVIVKLGGYDLAKLIDINVSLNSQMKHSLETTQDHVYIISTQDNGDFTFSEDRMSVEKDFLIKHVAERYGIKGYISQKIEEEDGVVKFTYLISNDSTTGTGEPTTSNEILGGGEQVKARPRIGRPKGTGKKLSVLSDNLHPGI